MQSAEDKNLYYEIRLDSLNRMLAMKSEEKKELNSKFKITLEEDPKYQTNHNKYQKAVEKEKLNYDKLNRNAISRLLHRREITKSMKRMASYRRAFGIESANIAGEMRQEKLYELFPNTEDIIDKTNVDSKLIQKEIEIAEKKIEMAKKRIKI